MDLVGNTEQILGAGSFDNDRHRRPAIDLIEGCNIVKLILDLGNISHGQNHSIRLGHQRQLSDVLSDFPLVFSSKQDLLALASDLSAWEFHVLLTDDVGYLTECQAVLSKSIFADLHIDLIRFDVDDLGLGNVGKFDQSIANIFGKVS